MPGSIKDFNEKVKEVTCGGPDLYSQLLGSWGRIAASLRPSWTIQLSPVSKTHQNKTSGLGTTLAQHMRDPRSNSSTGKQIQTKKMKEKNIQR